MEKKRLLETGVKVSDSFEDDGVIKYAPLKTYKPDKKIDFDGELDWLEQSKRLAEKCAKERLRREKEEEERRRKEEAQRAKMKA